MKKIVIIDDEYFFRQALIKYVRNFKDEFTVVGDAGNGKLGIELIEQYHPEIILIDINMPQMTGFDVISYIQKQALQTRFIIISGYDKFEYGVCAKSHSDGRAGFSTEAYNCRESV